MQMNMSNMKMYINYDMLKIKINPVMYQMNGHTYRTINIILN